MFGLYSVLKKVLAARSEREQLMLETALMMSSDLRYVFIRGVCVNLETVLLKAVCSHMNNVTILSVQYGTVGHPCFHPMTQYVTVCARLKAWLASRVSLRLARLPRTASSTQTSCRLCSTRAALPVLLAHAGVTYTYLFPRWAQTLVPHGSCNDSWDAHMSAFRTLTVDFVTYNLCLYVFIYVNVATDSNPEVAKRMCCASVAMRTVDDTSMRKSILLLMSIAQNVLALHVFKSLCG